MTDPSAPPTDRPPAPEPKRRVSRPSPSLLLDGLERFRECVQQQLDRLEALALHRAELLTEATERERALRQRVAELETYRGQFQDEIEQHEQEWREAVEQLESDRRLLAEAWERLERLQIDGGSTSVLPSSRPTAVERSVGLAIASPRAAPSLEISDPVAQTILKQFQTLRGDVRRASQERQAE